MLRVRGPLLVFMAASLLGACLGCSDRAPDMPELGTVTGKVTLGGQPVPNVSVYFKPDVGRMSIGKTNELGVYEAMYLVDEPGVKVGPCTVTLEYAPDDSGPPIPPKYRSGNGLKMDVKPGKSEFDISMDSK